MALPLSIVKVPDGTFFFAFFLPNYGSVKFKLARNYNPENALENLLRISTLMTKF